MSTIWLWVGFLVFVLVMLALDLGILHRESKVISTRQALIWTGFCAILSLLFCGATYYIYDHNWLGIAEAYGQQLSGKQAALQFLTGWLIEQSLSLDNILVIALIFTYFRVALEHQHRVLFWGIMGALIMRGAMILAGTALIHRFSWITYVFGALLILTAIKLLVTSDDHIEPEKNWLIRIARRFYPVSAGFDGHHFFTRIDGRNMMTPLFLVLLVVESTDVLFAVDSIPAIFAVTTDPFLVFTSNVFAILSLRSMYFALAGVMDRFRYIKTSLVFVLAFVGVKMLLAHAFPEAMPTGLSLAIVGGILGVGVAASFLAPMHDKKAPPPVAADLNDMAQLTWKYMRRFLILIGGTVVILIGVAISPIPGPGGIPVILIGLAILATEFVWAKLFLKRVKKRAMALRDAILGNGQGTSPSSDDESVARKAGSKNPAPGRMSQVSGKESGVADSQVPV